MLVGLPRLSIIMILLRSMPSSRSAAFLLKSSHPCRLLSSASATNNDDDSLPNSNAGVVDSPSLTIYYNDVYEVDMPPGHRFPMKKYRLVREGVQAKVFAAEASLITSGSIITNEQKGRRAVHCNFHISPLATKEQLITTHDPKYVHRYLTGNMTESENRNIGFPWSIQHVNRSLSSVGGTVAAAISAWEEYIRRNEYLQCINDGNKKEKERHISTTTQPTLHFLNETTKHLCWAAHTAGGTHHAFYNRGEGFCIFSDIAVAANVLLATYPTSIHRILIIDLDVHQGNGNAALFAMNDHVQTFSMHCSGNYFSQKEMSDLDVEVPVGCDDSTYLSTLRHWLKRIELHRFDNVKSSVHDNDKEQQPPPQQRKKFDLIFFQAGVDIHENDRLGRLCITSSGITKRNAMVFDFAHRMQCPLVITMGGGYPKEDDWSSIINAHVGVYWEAYQYLSTIIVDD